MFPNHYGNSGASRDQSFIEQWVTNSGDSRSALTKEGVYSYECHSIHGIRITRDEYIVFDAENVASVEEVEAPPED
jgi:hypothetical protein